VSKSPYCLVRLPTDKKIMQRSGFEIIGFDDPDYEIISDEITRSDVRMCDFCDDQPATRMRYCCVFFGCGTGGDFYIYWCQDCFEKKKRTRRPPSNK
jgi:hypothetical protein